MVGLRGCPITTGRLERHVKLFIREGGPKVSDRDPVKDRSPCTRLKVVELGGSTRGRVIHWTSLCQCRTVVEERRW